MRLLLFNLATDADDPILGFTSRWISALARRAESVDVITMRAGRLELPANVRVYSAGKEKGYSEARRAVEFYRLLRRILRESRPDACFSHMMPLFTVMGGPLLRARGIPIVTWYAHPALTRTLRMAHSLSDCMVTSLPSAYPYKKDKLRVIGQGIDTDLFAPDGSQPDGPPMILCPGRLSPVKEHIVLLEAVAILRQKENIEFTVTILGGPATSKDVAYSRELREVAARLQIGDLIRWEPVCSHAELPVWYRRSTLGVNMTCTGSGDKTVWESLSCERPCLAANLGFSETLGQYASTLQYKARDPADLATKIAHYLLLPAEQRRHYGPYLREQVLRLHSLEALGDKLTNLLDALRGRTGEAPR